jgi:hypothetical protein
MLRLQNIKDYILRKLERRKEESVRKGGRIRYVILDLSPVTGVRLVLVCFERWSGRAGGNGGLGSAEEEAGKQRQACGSAADKQAEAAFGEILPSVHGLGTSGCCSLGCARPASRVGCIGRQDAKKGSLASPGADVDATAVHFFHDFLRILSEDGLKLALANPSKQASAVGRRNAGMGMGRDYVIGGTGQPA